jgi:hypothetical protein
MVQSYYRNHLFLNYIPGCKLLMKSFISVLLPEPLSVVGKTERNVILFFNQPSARTESHVNITYNKDALGQRYQLG